MKKSKIWIPILAVAGTAATVAPLVCLTACNTIHYTLFHNCLGSDATLTKNKAGDIIITGTMDGSSKVNSDTSCVNTIFSNGDEDTILFKDNTTDINVSYQGTKATITIKAAFFHQYQGKTIKSVEIKIYGKN